MRARLLFFVLFVVLVLSAYGVFVERALGNEEHQQEIAQGVPDGAYKLDPSLRQGGSPRGIGIDPNSASVPAGDDASRENSSSYDYSSDSTPED